LSMQGFFGIYGARDGIELLATGCVFDGLCWFCFRLMPPNMPPKRKVPLSFGQFSHPAKVSR
ncbi:hypothetical protein, partial [Pseudomonas sp.]